MTKRRRIFTSARHTLVSFFLRVLAFFMAFLLLSTGTLIIGVLMLELATIRISLSLGSTQGNTYCKTIYDVQHLIIMFW